MRARALTAFGLVGIAAVVVHFTVAAATVPLGVTPLVANVLGFAAAFAVSFVGHGRWSFPARQRRTAVALPRFAAVALGGFALNEALYAVLLRYTALDYRLALLAVLGAVAGVTLVASKHWAFAVDRF